MLVNMKGASPRTQLLRRLLEVNSEAADIGEYEVAYHALMAALHAAEGVAEETNSDETILEIADIAKRQGARLEKVEPTHQLSKAAARTRGHSSVYETLLVHADSARQRVAARKRRDATSYNRPDTAAD
jgi:hypothetical protein